MSCISHAFQTLQWVDNQHEESLAELTLVAHQIADRRMPLRRLAELLHLGTTRLRRQFQHFGIPFVSSPCRLPGSDLEEIRRLVTDLRVSQGIKCGYRRAAESIAQPGEAPPYWAVRQVMHRDKPISERRKDLHEHRLESKYVDYLWHTDLHEILIPDEETDGRRIVYLIAFLDDASRFTMHHRLIFNKTAEICSAILLEALELWGPPCVLGSDNGREFVGIGILVKARVKLRGFG
jgi:hypothetical protein